MSLPQGYFLWEYIHGCKLSPCRLKWKFRSSRDLENGTVPQSSIKETNMKRLMLLVTIFFVCTCAAQVTYRPTTSGDSMLPYCGSQGSNTYQASGQDLSDAYDSEGSATAADLSLSQAGQGAGIWYQQIISGFSHTSGTHSSVKLVMDSACSGQEDSRSQFSCFISYSTNAGASWRNTHGSGSGWTETIDNISLSNNIDLANVYVKVCVRAQGHGSSSVDLLTYDVRADVTN